MSKYNEKSKAYTIEYIKNNYDEIKLRLPIGTKDIIKHHIEQYKDMLPLDMQSMQGFIKAAINEKLTNDINIQEKEYDYMKMTKQEYEKLMARFTFLEDKVEKCYKVETTDLVNKLKEEYKQYVDKF